MIVLNGEPFVRYSLRALYPWAHQIVVVEGACPAAAGVSTPSGHSLDGTLDALRCFAGEEDPEGKVTIVTAEDEGHPSGFWPGEKDEMSRAYAKRATGNYLWQVDSDEFYLEDAMEQVIGAIRRGADSVSFPTRTFWGGLQYEVDGFYLRAYRAREYHRLFAWSPRSCYATHRPPTVIDEDGVDTRAKKWVRASQMEQLGVYMHHYSLLFPWQVGAKCDYYSRVPWTDRASASAWADQVFTRLEQPFRVHNVYDHISWLGRYDGPHPIQVQEMVRAVADGVFAGMQMRRTDDIERILASRTYRISRWALASSVPAVRASVSVRSRLGAFRRRLLRGKRR